MATPPPSPPLSDYVHNLATIQDEEDSRRNRPMSQDHLIRDMLNHSNLLRPAPVPNRTPNNFTTPPSSPRTTHLISSPGSAFAPPPGTSSESAISRSHIAARLSLVLPPPLPLPLHDLLHFIKSASLPRPVASNNCAFRTPPSSPRVTYLTSSPGLTFAPPPGTSSGSAISCSDAAARRSLVLPPPPLPTVDPPSSSGFVRTVEKPKDQENPS